MAEPGVFVWGSGFTSVRSDLPVLGGVVYLYCLQLCVWIRVWVVVDLLAPSLECVLRGVWVCMGDYVGLCDT